MREPTVQRKFEFQIGINRGTLRKYEARSVLARSVPWWGSVHPSTSASAPTIAAENCRMLLPRLYPLVPIIAVLVPIAAERTGLIRSAGQAYGPGSGPDPLFCWSV
jgi:hypothetical protein